MFNIRSIYLYEENLNKYDRQINSLKIHILIMVFIKCMKHFHLLTELNMLELLNIGLNGDKTKIKLNIQVYNKMMIINLFIKSCLVQF